MPKGLNFRVASELGITLIGLIRQVGSREARSASQCMVDSY